jgi:hypothetical protein
MSTSIIIIIILLLLIGSGLEELSSKFDEYNTHKEKENRNVDPFKEKYGDWEL